MLINSNYKITLLKAVLFNYSLQVIRATPKRFHKELWYKQALAIGKYFKTRTPDKIDYLDSRLISIKIAEIAKLDEEFFKGKDYSSYIIMYEVLRLLISRDINDLEMISKFVIFPVEQISNELFGMSQLKDIVKESNKFITKVLEIIDILDEYK